MPSSACDWSSDVCSSDRSEEHTSELQSRSDLVCRLLLEKKKNTTRHVTSEFPNTRLRTMPTTTRSIRRNYTAVRATYDTVRSTQADTPQAIPLRGYALLI